VHHRPVDRVTDEKIWPLPRRSEDAEAGQEMAASRRGREWRLAEDCGRHDATRGQQKIQSQASSKQNLI
jgi:hypothetical protein